MVITNVGASLRELGWPDATPRILKLLPPLDAVLLRQRWTLFSFVSPFNYTTHFEIVLADGRTVELSDQAQQNATGWNAVLFYNETKIQNNLYGSPMALRRYMEYLIRKNGIAPAEVRQRVIFIRYRMILPRAGAAAAGSHSGTEGRFDLDTY